MFRFQLGPNTIKAVSCASWEPWDSQDTNTLGAREDNVDPLYEGVPLLAPALNTLLRM